MAKDNESINNLTKDVNDYIACKNNTLDINQLLIESSKSSEDDNFIDIAINTNKDCIKLGEKISNQIQIKKVKDAINVTKARLDFNIMYLNKIHPTSTKRMSQQEISAASFGFEVIKQHEESSWEGITKENITSTTPIVEKSIDSYYVVGFVIILLLFLISKSKNKNSTK